jgi:hypothetical protein
MDVALKENAGHGAKGALGGATPLAQEHVPMPEIVVLNPHASQAATLTRLEYSEH